MHINPRAHFCEVGEYKLNNKLKDKYIYRNVTAEVFDMREIYLDEEGEAEGKESDL